MICIRPALKLVFMSKLNDKIQLVSRNVIGSRFSKATALIFSHTFQIVNSFELTLDCCINAVKKNQDSFPLSFGTV
jgi:hypothetical protein